MSEVAQSCPTLCDPMDCILPCSSIRGIFQAKVLEWVAISFSVTHITTEQIAASQPGVKPLLILALLPSKVSLSPSLQPHCQSCQVILLVLHTYPSTQTSPSTHQGRQESVEVKGAGSRASLRGFDPNSILAVWQRQYEHLHPRVAERTEMISDTANALDSA